MGKRGGQDRVRLRRVLSLGALLALVLIAFTAEDWLGALGRWLAIPSAPRPAEVIAVLGGGLERLRYAAELRDRGLAPELWQTGGPGDREAVLAIRYERGWPAESVAFLPSESTWEDVAVIIAEAERRGVRRILVVTSWYHSRRAVCSLEKQLAGRGISVAFASPPAADRWWNIPASRRHVANELAKLAAYTALYGLNPWNCTLPYTTSHPGDQDATHSQKDG
ncbi:MAG: YdcF family protein [Oscillochloridaceae bacterium]|nr:YdcF family protein [Chloroflexaceae bacterium]MDW8388713.1 YdcF family protein [Oscillochloridaceae bacterium]